MARRIYTFATILGSISAGAFAPFARADPAFIYTDNPVANSYATIQLTGNATASYTALPIGYNYATGIQSPNVYWFKYVSDGKSAVTFDTFGSDFGDYGPGGGSSGGTVLGTYNQSQIAVYNSAGTLVADSKGETNANGDPIYPWYTPSHSSPQWYYSQGLSQLNLVPSPPVDPHWLASPTDPTIYVGPNAPDNGPGQTYNPPMNEYHVWLTALEPVINGSTVSYYQRDNSNNIVYSGGSPVPEAGWRFGDYARVGPGASYNRAGALAAGTYYIAVTSDVTMAGDTYPNAILAAPGNVNFDPLTQTFGPAISSPLTFGQYYDDVGDPTYSNPKYQDINGNPYFNPYSNMYGTIQLNVTQRIIGDLNGDGQINIDDYLIMDNSFLHGLPAITTLSDPNYWASGDLNDDGVVNYIDYAIEDAALKSQGGTQADALIALHLQEFGAPYAAAMGLAAVPEPATLGMLMIGAGALLMRKRRALR